MFRSEKNCFTPADLELTSRCTNVFIFVHCENLCYQNHKESKIRIQFNKETIFIKKKKLRFISCEIDKNISIAKEFNQTKKPF